jgi:hypothetical protein
MKNSELNNQQTDWLAKTEELNDIEASQVNGGAVGYSAADQQEDQLRQEEDQLIAKKEAQEAAARQQDEAQKAQYVQSDQMAAKAF